MDMSTSQPPRKQTNPRIPIPRQPSRPPFHSDVTQEADAADLAIPSGMMPPLIPDMPPPPITQPSALTLTDPSEWAFRLTGKAIFGLLAAVLTVAIPLFTGWVTLRGTANAADDRSRATASDVILVRDEQSHLRSVQALHHSDIEVLKSEISNEGRRLNELKVDLKQQMKQDKDEILTELRAMRRRGQ